MCLDFAELANDVRQVGVVVESGKLFAACADGKHWYEVTGVAIGGPTDAVGDIEHVECGLHKGVERRVECALVFGVLGHEGGVECILELLIVLFAYFDSAI